MKDFDIWNITAKYLAGESTPAESKMLEKWILDSDSNKKEFEKIKKIWNSKTPDLKINKENMWENISQQANFQKDKKTLLNNNLFKYAAVIVFFVLLPLIYFTSDNSNNLDNNLLETKVDFGKTKSIVLSDGSKVLLDAGSTLKFPNKFSSDKRIIHLEGEGFFEIAHNPDKPFIIKMSDSQVKVLGTKFNLKSWNSKSEISVSEGKVSFSGLNPDKTIILTAGYKSRLDDSGNPISAEKFNLNNLSSWIKKEYLFRNEKLENIFSQLERWYNLKISIDDKLILDQKINLEIKNQPFENTLEIIGMIINKKYRLTENKVFFY